VTRGAAGLFATLLLACSGEEPLPPAPPDPSPTTAWHQEPVRERRVGKGILLLDHADPSIDADRVLSALERQYAWLAEYVGTAPRWVVVHVGARYPCGFAIGSSPYPEMFLRAGPIADTSNDYAHEMTHCFAFRYGQIPHWLNESLADAAYADAEISLYGRREEAEILGVFDRVDHRSYELMRLRARYGAGFVPRVFRTLERRIEECRRILGPGTTLEEKNLFLLSVLSEAAGEDLTPRFRDEFGFNPRTRERQRGY
jgi:hypothetical protein